MLKLEIELGTLYVDGMRMCFADSDKLLPKGKYEVSTIYSHAHGCELPNAAGLGWIGPTANADAPPCDVLLGRVRDGNGSVIHHHPYVTKLLAMLEVIESRGETTVLSVV